MYYAAAMPGGTDDTTLAFERGQRELLEQIAGGAALPAVLDHIVRLIEAQAAEMVCSILLVDREHGVVHHGAAPHLPPEFVRSIDGSAIGPTAGSCGTAAYLGKPVIVEDIATHPYWNDYRALALPFGLRACWSSPILDAGGKVLGTFAMYFREPRGPSRSEETWVARATHLASIAITLDQNLQALRKQAALIDHAKDAILVRDLDATIRFWSRGAERIYGWTIAEAVGRKAFELLATDQGVFERANARVQEAGEWTGELVQRSKTGKRLAIEASWTLLRDAAGNPQSVLAINTDITEQRQLEAQVARALRIESLGTLAGGIAHDFNNILAAVSANVMLAQDDLPADHPAREALAEIGKAGARAAELVRRILTFSDRQQPKRKPMRLEVVVSEAIDLLRATVPSDIALDVHIDPDVPTVLADPTQVHQVVMNLCANALHAMAHGGGVLGVSVAPARLNARLPTGTGEIASGDYARLIVSDTGAGMDEITLERIFDPFFTTKGPGQGTGLGLAVVHGVIKSHGGGMLVRSALGHGATFSVFLPATESKRTSDAPPPERKQPEHGAGRRVLVVDDEQAIVRVLTQLLQRIGYAASGESDPVRALATFKADPQGFDAVLLDMSMPRLAGPDLARELLSLRPDLPIVMTSGRIGPEDVQSLRALGVREILMKPSSIDELAAALDRHLR